MAAKARHGGDVEQQDECCQCEADRHVAHALALLVTHPAASGMYNVADDEPVTELGFFEWLAGRLGRPLPERADAAALAGRRRGATSKRVSNRRLRQELGCPLEYPTFREGYEPEVQRIQALQGL